MKLALGILAVVAVAASLFADYKWRQWITARRPDRQESDTVDLSRHHDR